METAKIETLKANILGEALLFGLLGKILYAELDRAWLEALIRDNVFAESPLGEEQPEVQLGLELLRRWTEENRQGIPEAEFKNLKSEQLRLFIGVDRVLVPVWESVYFNENRLVFQQQTLQVRDWYARFGLQLEKLNKEPDDHIGLELVFVAHLASRCLTAMEAGNQAEVDQLLQAQKDFLAEHLLRWGPAWARLVKQHAATDFYRGVAHLTHGALLAAADFLHMEMPKEVSL